MTAYSPIKFSPPNVRKWSHQQSIVVKSEPSLPQWKGDYRSKVNDAISYAEQIEQERIDKVRQANRKLASSPAALVSQNLPDTDKGLPTGTGEVEEQENDRPNKPKQRFNRPDVAKT